MSKSVVQWGESVGKHGVLCIIITRKYVHHIRIIVHMDISFIVLPYTLFFVRIVFSVLLCCIKFVILYALCL